MLDPPLANHQRDQLRPEPFQLTVEAIHAVREDVVPEDRRNGHGESERPNPPDYRYQSYASDLAQVIDFDSRVEITIVPLRE